MSSQRNEAIKLVNTVKAARCKSLSTEEYERQENELVEFNVRLYKILNKLKIEHFTEKMDLDETINKLFDHDLDELIKKLPKFSELQKDDCISLIEFTYLDFISTFLTELTLNKSIPPEQIKEIQLAIIEKICSKFNSFDLSSLQAEYDKLTGKTKDVWIKEYIKKLKQRKKIPLLFSNPSSTFRQIEIGQKSTSKVNINTVCSQISVDLAAGRKRRKSSRKARKAKKTKNNNRKLRRNKKQTVKR